MNIKGLNETSIMKEFGDILKKPMFLNDIGRYAISLGALTREAHFENKKMELKLEKMKEIIFRVNQNEFQVTMFNLLEKYRIYDSNSLNSLAQSMEKNFWKDGLADPEGRYTKALEMVSKDLKNINQNLSMHYKRMVYLNVFIVIDEYLRKILKNLYMYDIDYIKDKKLILSIEKIANEENFEELKENRIDEFTNDFNIEEKFKRLNWIIRNKFEFEPFDDEVIKEIKIYRIERNSLVHAEGVILEKYIKDLIKIDAKVFNNLKKDESFTYEIEKTRKMINLFMCFCEDLETIIKGKIEKDIFGEILFYDKPLILKQYMNSPVFKKYPEFVK